MNGPLRLLVLLVCLALVGGCRPAPEPSSAAQNLSYEFSLDGLDRSYAVHLPPGRTDEPRPVLLALHGGGGSAAQLASSSGLDQVADQRGFLVVYGQGTSWGKAELPVWNAGGCCGRAVDAEQAVDDVGYVREVLRRVTADFAVDPQRVFVTGMSNGAMLAERLACEAADLFAGAASVSGVLQMARCEPSRPVALLLIHGTDDAAVPYRGGTGTGFSRVEAMPTEQDLAGWAARNGCAGPVATEPLPTLPDENGRTVDRLSYADCAAPVVLYRVNGGVHEWPGGRIDGPLNHAEPTTAIRASEAVADFFGL
ncbi:MAG: PHB depolymerase family esterase [Propionicimonas sp.]